MSKLILAAINIFLHYMFVIVYNLAFKSYIICNQEDNHIEQYMNK